MAIKLEDIGSPGQHFVQEKGEKDKHLLPLLVKGMKRKKVRGGIIFTPTAKSKALINKRK